jgi:uncharacterized membrane protein YoaK (UPF0700 family)
MKLSLPVLLSFNAGYVDTVGYLALQGLFTAHVTGNFVTIGAALAFGTSGVVTKLSALPVFCLVILLTRLAGYGFQARNRRVLPAVLTLKFSLLAIAAGLAIWWGPFVNGDSWRAWATGMTLVAAMAIQNAAHRIHLGATPPSTLMTGNTTQIMIDVADCIRGLPAETRAATIGRLRQMTKAVLSFAVGAAAAALLFSTMRMWCFAVAPLVAGLARLAGNTMDSGSSSHGVEGRPLRAT